MTRVEFFVPGDPVPQGTTRSFARNGRVITTNDPSGRLERWRGDIRQAAVHTGAECIDGPVAVHVDFLFARPQSHYLPVTKSRPVRVLRPDAPTWHTQKPDGDRCLRAVLDALTAVLYVDDQQGCDLHATKHWTDSTPGALLVVSEVLA